MYNEGMSQETRQARKKYKNPKKPNIISMRISDDEMKSIQQLMEITEKNASELMRDAFLLYISKEPVSRAA